MAIDFEIKLDTLENGENDLQEIAKRVRAVLGVPEAFLETDVVTSPVFLNKANRYIYKYIKDYLDIIDLDNVLLQVAYIYHIAYQVCLGMDARLPKQMENISTKTIFQTISWDDKALELLNRCNEALENVLEEYDIEQNLYGTFAELSNEMDYPNTSI